MIEGALVLARGIRGSADASAARRLSTPRTRSGALSLVAHGGGRARQRTQDRRRPLRPAQRGLELQPAGSALLGAPFVTAASQNYRTDSTGGFAIPIERAAGIADAIRSGTASGSTHVGPTGILGVAIANHGDQSGVLIRGILRGGPVEAAGPTPGDVITAIDGVTTRDATALTDVLDGHRPGDTVTLTYLDGGRTAQSAPVTLAAGPPN